MIHVVKEGLLKGVELLERLNGELLTFENKRSPNSNLDLSRRKNTLKYICDSASEQKPNEFFALLNNYFLDIGKHILTIFPTFRNTFRYQFQQIYFDIFNLDKNSTLDEIKTWAQRKTQQKIAELRTWQERNSINRLSPTEISSKNEKAINGFTDDKDKGKLLWHVSEMITLINTTMITDEELLILQRKVEKLRRVTQAM